MKTLKANWPAFIIAFVLFSAAIPVVSQSVTLSPTDAASHIGENATVTGTVDGVHQSDKGNIFLNMGGKYPNQAFTAFIPAKAAGMFADFAKYNGKNVAVSGKITLYHGKPEIIVTSAGQVRML